MLIVALALQTLAGAVAAQERPNVLLVLMDDVGVDLFESTDTPHLDALAAAGARFRICYASPSCSPTRASILRGLWPHQTGVGVPVPHSKLDSMAGPFTPGRVLDSLPALLRDATYRTAAIGKWHLVHDSYPLLQQQSHPLAWGFDEHHGPLAGGLFPTHGWSYTEWQQSSAVTGFAPTYDWVTGYATTRQVDDALDFMAAGERPYFVWLALNAPHLPAHLPPYELTTTPQPWPWPAPSTKFRIGLAMEALDTEFGRLMESVDLTDTWVIVIGDNGSHEAITGDPLNAKGSIREGGVRVPLLVAGPGVLPGSEPVTPAAALDLWATVLDAVGLDVPAGHPARSLLRALAQPATQDHAWTFAERFLPNGPGPWTEHEAVARAGDYALVRDVLTGDQALYDLATDPQQQTPLAWPWTPEQVTAAVALGAVLDAELQR